MNSKQKKLILIFITAIIFLSVIAYFVIRYRSPNSSSDSSQREVQPVTIFEEARINGTDTEKANMAIYDATILIQNKKYDEAIKKLEPLNFDLLGENKLPAMSLLAAAYGGTNNLKAVVDVSSRVLEGGLLSDDTQIKNWTEIKNQAESGVNPYTKYIEESEKEQR